jgi:hypothetical protein
MKDRIGEQAIVVVLAQVNASLWYYSRLYVLLKSFSRDSLFKIDCSTGQF